MKTMHVAVRSDTGLGACPPESLVDSALDMLERMRLRRGLAPHVAERIYWEQSAPMSREPEQYWLSIYRDYDA